MIINQFAFSALTLLIEQYRINKIKEVYEHDKEELKNIIKSLHGYIKDKEDHIYLKIIQEQTDFNFDTMEHEIE
jgi:hypothetical protein